MFVQLTGIVNIVPDCVESACNRYKRVPEGISHPDAEYGVLLAEGLAGFDAAATFTAYAPSYPELECAAYQGYQSYAGQGPDAAVAVYDGAGAHQDGQGQGNAPQVEAHVDL